MNCCGLTLVASKFRSRATSSRLLPLLPVLAVLLVIAALVTLDALFVEYIDAPQTVSLLP
jgi:hypothetical protein